MKSQLENMLQNCAEIRENLSQIGKKIYQLRSNYAEQNKAFQACLEEKNELEKRVKKLENIIKSKGGENEPNG